MKKVDIPVSGAGNNCLYICLAAHFYISYHNDNHSAELYDTFQDVVNTILGPRSLDSILNLDYDTASQILGISLRAHLHQGKNEEAETEIVDVVSSVPAITEMFGNIYELQGYDASEAVGYPDYSFLSIEDIPPTSMIIRWTRSGHFQLVIPESDIAQLKDHGVSYKEDSQSIETTHAMKLSAFRADVKTQDKVFFASENELSKDAKALFNDLLIQSVQSQDGADHPLHTSTGLFGSQKQEALTREARRAGADSTEQGIFEAGWESVMQWFSGRR